MPEIARFYGIVIKMYFNPKEHEPGHIHAIYNEYVGVIEIESLKMTEGDLPRKAQALVREWITEHRQELLNMWVTQKLTKLPPLK